MRFLRDLPPETWTHRKEGKICAAAEDVPLWAGILNAFFSRPRTQIGPFTPRRKEDRIHLNPTISASRSLYLFAGQAREQATGASSRPPTMVPLGFHKSTET